MRAIEVVREHIKTEEFDYGMLMQALCNYKKPRDALSHLLKAKSILRIKKGLYTFGGIYRRTSICKESLANLIYGPSYISLEYALSYYGMIPERVEQITSITSMRSKTFETPLGIFAYMHLDQKKCSIGITMIKADARHQFFIASPEKALADRIAFHRNLRKSQDVHGFVCEGLRIEEESLAKLDISLLEDIKTIYNNPAVTALLQIVKELAC